MKMLYSCQKLACQFIALLIFLPIVASAQLISVRSVPIAAVEQFLLVPSQNLGMGGVTMALEDPSADPFVNPAKGGRLRGVYLFSAPVFGNITEENGGVRTLPLGALLGAEKWFGGMTLAGQQLRAPERFNFFSSLAEQNKNNLYAAGLLGKKISDSGISLAASASWAELQAMHGVNFLYGNSSRIEQRGHIADYRLGLLYEKTPQSTLEILLLHNRVRMKHDVYYQTWFWEGDLFANSRANRIVQELDQTNTWGLHLGSMLPFKNPHSRAGFIFTTNYKTHPKIPNYELMNIPRDPGTTWAFNFGAGLAYASDSSAFGIDFIFEPIWSHTWAEAVEPVKNDRGAVVVPHGGKTVENYFRFHNALVRLGLNAQGNVFGFQLGLQARFIHYRLQQTNFIGSTFRTQKEFWSEWTPSAGFNLNFAPFQLRYTGRLTAGTGQPGVESSVVWGRAAMTADSNFIIAPSGRLTLEDAMVLTHQIAVVVKLQSLR